MSRPDADTEHTTKSAVRAGGKTIDQLECWGNGPINGGNRGAAWEVLFLKGGRWEGRARSLNRVPLGHLAVGRLRLGVDPGLLSLRAFGRGPAKAEGCLSHAGALEVPP
jgi:hypothetical protein